MITQHKHTTYADWNYIYRMIRRRKNGNHENDNDDKDNNDNNGNDSDHNTNDVNDIDNMKLYIISEL